MLNARMQVLGDLTPKPPPEMAAQRDRPRPMFGRKRQGKEEEALHTSGPVLAGLRACSMTEGHLLR